MKNVLFALSGLALLYATLSCSKDNVSELNRKSITISPFTEVTTKAPVVGTTFPDRSIVVAAYYYATGGGSSAPFFSNVTFSKEGSVWTSDKYWPMTGKLDFLAYSCPLLNPTPTYGGTKNTDQVSLPISDNASVQEDILFAYAPQSDPINTAIAMSFKHAQALITFKAKSSVSYNASNNEGITITNITLNGAKYSGTCLISNNGSCSWSELGSQADKSMPDFSSTNLTTSLSGQLGTGILVPEQICTTATITYTLHNGKQGSVNQDIEGLVKTVTLTSPDSSWLEGKNYCYELNITEYDITIVPTVTDWVVVNPDSINIP